MAAASTSKTTTSLPDSEPEELIAKQQHGGGDSDCSSNTTTTATTPHTHRSSESIESYNLILEDQIHFNGFFFENMPKPRSPQLRRPLNLNLREYCDNLNATSRLTNHGIYSIDEISEVSGRSELLLINERNHMEKVNQILAVQQAHRLQRLANQCCSSSETKLFVNKKPSQKTTASQSTDSTTGSSAPSSPRLRHPTSYRNCRIFIPPQRPKSTIDEAIDDSEARKAFGPQLSNSNIQQIYKAFIFDLEGPMSNRSFGPLSNRSFTSSSSVTDFPSQNLSKRSSTNGRSRSASLSSSSASKRPPLMRSGAGDGEGGKNNMSKSENQCCGCFGFGGKKYAREEKNGGPVLSDEDTYLLL